MIDSQIQHALLQELGVLPREKQQQVLDYVRAIATPRLPGTPGINLLKHAGSIPPDDCDRMLRAIEEGCEQIDPDGW